MTVYWLVKHAYVCATADHVVILDLVADRYVALTHRQARTLDRTVHGWPVGHEPIGAEEPSEAETTLSMLLRRKLLTSNSAHGKAATPVSNSPPTIPLIETALLHTLLEDAPRPPRITLSDVISFATTYISARRRLHKHGLARIVSELADKRHNWNPVEFDPVFARDLVAKFRLLRTFFYTARDRCLLDSYVLLEFLAKFQVRPAWTFAVRTCPFAAHCWVQHEQYVLNDTPEHAGQYHPIMIV